jgi:hypothetical protein
MNAIAPITRRSLDQLETDIISLSSHINSMEYEFLVLLREFDLRQGWKEYHFTNCADWMNMKCGMAPCTAREKLRVANALFDLPQTSTAFAQGELSYSKVRSLTRILTPHNEEQHLDFAIKATAAQVDKHCLELRNVQREISIVDANRLYEHRYLSWSAHSDGSVTLSVELPKESADLVIRAIEKAAGGNSSEENEPGDNPPRGALDLFQQQADALVDLARTYLSGENGKNSCTADHYQVTVHVDEKALRGEPDSLSKSDLPVETVRRLCCDSSLVVSTDDDRGKTKDLSRKHRVVHPSLRRKLMSRDKGCRFPGCTHEKWLDAHHVVHWADGGETTAENLVMLCSTHHRLLHEGGFEIKPGAAGQWHFRNAGGMRTAGNSRDSNDPVEAP